jgi:hypothetical protein
MEDNPYRTLQEHIGAPNEDLANAKRSWLPWALKRSAFYLTVFTALAVWRAQRGQNILSVNLAVGAITGIILAETIGWTDRLLSPKSRRRNVGEKSMWGALSRASIALAMLLANLGSGLCLLIGVLFILWYFASPAANVNGVPAWVIGAPLVVLAIVLQTAYIMLRERRN